MKLFTIPVIIIILFQINSYSFLKTKIKAKSTPSDFERLFPKFTAYPGGNFATY